MTVNKATKISDIFLSKEKEYYGEIKLGILTDSWDITGNIVKEEPIKSFSFKSISNIIKSFEGKYTQDIPAYSAKKKDGQPLYKYARKGQIFSEIKNDVFIYKARLLKAQKGSFAFKVKCSSGTYIRSIANDICKRLITAGVLAKLVRVKIGKFSVKNSIEPEKILDIVTDIRSEFRNVNKEEIKKIPWLCEIKNLNIGFKNIKVKKNYYRQISEGHPLFANMIDFGKTIKHEYNEKDLIKIKIFRENRIFLHKVLKDFNIEDLNVADKIKLTKFIIEIK